jgi:hypothetical protein
MHPQFIPQQIDTDAFLACYQSTNAGSAQGGLRPSETPTNVLNRSELQRFKVEPRRPLAPWRAQVEVRWALRALVDIAMDALEDSACEIGETISLEHVALYAYSGAVTRIGPGRADEQALLRVLQAVEKGIRNVMEDQRDHLGMRQYGEKRWGEGAFEREKLGPPHGAEPGERIFTKPSSWPGKPVGGA